jgi:hypothetical protein
MPGISDLQADPRVNVRQRPTPAGVDGVQHEDGQLMVHDGAGQGGISSLPMQVDIAGQTHILSYLTLEEQARLRAGGGGIAADGGQIYGPGGVPAFADGAAGGGAGPSGSGGGGAGSGGSGGGEASPGDEGAEAAAAAAGAAAAGGAGPSGSAGTPSGSSGVGSGVGGAPGGPATGGGYGGGDGKGGNTGGQGGSDPYGGPGAGGAANQGGTADVAGLNEKSFADKVKEFAKQYEKQIAISAVAPSLVGLAIGAIGTIRDRVEAEYPGSTADPTTNDVDGSGGQGWADGSAAGYYIPGTISPLAQDVASGAAIASESAGSTPGTTTTTTTAPEYDGPDLSGTWYDRESVWRGNGGGMDPVAFPEWYTSKGYEIVQTAPGVYSVRKGGGDTAAPAPAPTAYPDDWNEADFLAANPDVAAAVEQGLYPSGYSFDQSFRRFTGGTGWDDRADTPGQTLDPRYSSDVYDQFLARNGRRQPVDVNTYYYG